MTLTQAVSRIAGLCNKLATETVKVVPRIKGHVNEVCRREWNGWPWSFRQREYPIALKIAVTAGTANVSNASQSVTLSSALLSTSEHKGWYFRVSSANPCNWYKVINVTSTTVFTISPAYQGTTNATASYELIKLDYDLPPEVDEVTTVKLMFQGRAVTLTDIPSISEGTPVLVRGLPQAATIYESNPIPATYSTGTVTGTAGLNTLTGASSPAWLANVLPGDVITISSIDYTVYEVLSDTSLVLYNALTTSPSGTAYSITRQFSPKLRITPGADLAYAAIVVARRKYHNLVANTDSNELLMKYESAVIGSAVELEHIAGPDGRAAEQNQRASTLWEQARGADRGTHPRQKRRPVFMSRQPRRR